jgi:hypothetical protein
LSEENYDTKRIVLFPCKYQEQIDFVANNDTWAYIKELERWVGTASPEELIVMLTKLDDFYEERIYIREAGEYIYLARSIPLEDFITLLENE